MKVKKPKLLWSGIPVDNMLLDACYKKYEQETGMPIEYLPKKALVAYILAQYIKEEK